jgi:hypothetical protein
MVSIPFSFAAKTIVLTSVADPRSGAFLPRGSGTMMIIPGSRIPDPDPPLYKFNFESRNLKLLPFPFKKIKKRWKINIRLRIYYYYDLILQEKVRLWSFCTPLFNGGSGMNKFSDPDPGENPGSATLGFDTF